MDRTERFYRIDQLLQSRGTVHIDTFTEELGVSIATFKRDLEYLRDRLHAPIVWDPVRRGYRLEAGSEYPGKFELPGLWFNASEIHALLTMQCLLAELQPGILEPHIAPLQSRLRAILDSTDHALGEVEQRIVILQRLRRKMDSDLFPILASGLLSRKVLRIAHYNRAADQTVEREVSPQRLTCYRENWYLDAWCHLRGDIRSFAVDAISRAEITDVPAREVSAVALDEVLKSGYGIFSGAVVAWATLKFNPLVARWVSREVWHPEQKTSSLPDGSYVIEVPYSNDAELMMDILKYGPDCEVLAPSSLREALQARISAMAQVYEGSVDTPPSMK